MYYNVSTYVEVYFNMPDKKESAYVSPEQAATYFGVDVEHIRRLCREGKIPGARKLGNLWRIPRTFLSTDAVDVQKMADEQQ
jgi:excisionase family DNA binding protein